jgi:uncharacterized protein (DUF1800 family)
VNFRYDPSYHDAGIKRIFAKRGAFNWQDSCRLCVTHPDHPSFFVTKLWSYFVAGAPDTTTRVALQRLYTGSAYEIRPVLEAILKHPALYQGPALVKSPVVFNAGLLRRLGEPIATNAWAWLGQMAGQQLFYPPNVGGWDDTRWLDTATWRGRWWIAQYVLRPHTLDPAKASAPDDAAALVDSALAFWHHPTLNEATTRGLLRFAGAALGDASKDSWKQKQYPVMVQNALRHLIAVSPELQAA